MLRVILVTFVSCVLSTGLGGLIAAAVKGDKDSTTGLFLGFAGGVMLSVVFFDLIPEALESGISLTVSGLFGGYFFVGLLDRICNRLTSRAVFQPSDCSDTPSRRRLLSGGITMALAVAVHNLPEGMVVGASSAGGSGLASAAVIGMHDVPEGLAIALPLIASGMPRKKAVLISALTGVPSVIGGMIGKAVGSMGETGLTLSLSFAAGAMLSVVLCELVPESLLMRGSRSAAFWTFVGTAAGIAVIFV